MKRQLPITIVRLLQVQAAIAVLGPALLVGFSVAVAWSFALGASINVVAQGIFALFAFRHRGARSATLIAQAFARGQSIKMVLIATLLGAALSQIKSIDPLSLLLGMLAVQSTIWFFLFIDRRPARVALRD